jgi:hypothetical protein
MRIYSGYFKPRALPTELLSASKFPDALEAFILKQASAGMLVAGICRKVHDPNGMSLE